MSPWAWRAAAWTTHAAISKPCATIPGSPADTAAAWSQWMGFQSPVAAAYRRRSPRLADLASGGSGDPTAGSGCSTGIVVDRLAPRGRARYPVHLPLRGPLSTTTKLEARRLHRPGMRRWWSHRARRTWSGLCERTRPTTPSTSTSLPMSKGRCHSNVCSAWITPRPASSGAAEESPGHCEQTSPQQKKVGPPPSIARDRPLWPPPVATPCRRVTVSGTGPIRQPSRRSK